MRILLVMDPFIKVPPEHYGGIERVIADLANGLARGGHQISGGVRNGGHGRVPLGYPP